MDTDQVAHAFLHFFHLDMANASIRLARPRFSPITFALAITQEVLDSDDLRVVYARDIVRRHVGAYEPDRGR